MTSGSLRAVLLDVDGTMYSAKPVQRGMLRRLALGHALKPWAGPKVLRALSAYRKGQEALRAEAQAGVARDLGELQLRFAAERSSVAQDEVRALVSKWMETVPLDLVAAARRPGLVEFLSQAKGRGWKVGVFSDYPPQGKLDSMGVGDEFDSVHWAQMPEIGCFKPDPRGLLHFAESFGLKPQECLYVGDRVEVDAAAAEAAGFHCAILQNEAVEQGSLVQTASEWPAIDRAPEAWRAFAGFEELNACLFRAGL